MSLSMLNRAAVAAAVASVIMGPLTPRAVSAADSVGEVRRDLKEETAERKAADVALEKELRGAVKSSERETLARSKAHADAVAERAKQEAKAHADREAAKAKKEAELHADKQAERAKGEAKVYTDAQTEKAKSDAKKHAEEQAEKAKKDASLHADEEVEKAKKESKAYTDAETEKTKREVKTYADEKVEIAKIEVKQHADDKVAQAELEAKLHADLMAEQAKLEAKTDANTKVQSAKAEAIADADSKITQTKSDIDVKLLQAKNEAASESKAYVDTVLVDTVNTVRADAINLADATLAAARAYTDSRLPAAPPAPRPSQAAALLMLDGEFAAWVDSLDVTLRAEVTRHDTGPGNPVNKVLAPTRFNDVALRLDPFGGTSAMVAWINGLLTGAPLRREVELYVLDTGGRVTSRLRLMNAIPLEVEFPALDNGGAAARGCAVTMKLYAEGVEDRPVANPPAAPPHRPMKGCRVDLEEVVVEHSEARPESGLRKISPFKIATTVNQIGSTRDYSDVFTPDIPDLVFTIASSGADGWREWFASSVLQGTPGQEARGKLVFRDDRGDDIGGLTLTGMGVFSSGFSAGTDGGKDDELQVKVYVQTMQLARSGN